MEQQAPAQSGQEAPRPDAAPPISLPKGGGAIRGVDEKLGVNESHGAASLSVPLPVSPGRDGWTPQHSLTYDSGGGNGPFGLGWTLDVPAITRRTDKGLPRYDDANESDIFVLTGADDLVPETDAEGRRISRRRVVHGTAYTVYPYRPRIEGMYARIERWTDRGGRSHWRTISADGITALFGFDPGSTVESVEETAQDAGAPSRIYSYLLCRRFDLRGHLTVYEHRAESGEGVDTAAAHEAKRTPAQRAAQRYLHAVRYGNIEPWHADWSEHGPEPELPGADAFHFELLLDYGEYDLESPSPSDEGRRAVRPDPFSSYRAGFEIRTYRRCLRALMFHHFPHEPTCGPHRLVRALELRYTDQVETPDPTAPVYTMIAAVVEAGYGDDPSADDPSDAGPRHPGRLLRRSLPPLEFEYSRAVVDPTIRQLPRESARNLPEGLADSAPEWVDLHAEGLPGALYRGRKAWWYKRNLSPLEPASGARLGELERVSGLPAGADVRLLDLSGGGHLDAVTFERGLAGYSERVGAENWTPWQPFTTMPTVAVHGPRQRMLDLTGNGTPDLLLAEDEVWLAYPSLGRAGYGSALPNRAPWDEGTGTTLVLSDEAESLHLADMTGDGLSDLVRTRNGEVAYWPNLGYGRFGRKVTMDRAPRFAAEGEFDPSRMRLADIDGTGSADLLYLGVDGVLVCFNQSGNAWSRPQRLAVFPGASPETTVQVLDLRGTGTSCLVWSSSLPSEAGAPLRYIDLMSGGKPHLLVRARNNVGGETRLTYAPSTRFSLADRERGEPWVTTLPFPVQVVERSEVFDWVTRSRFVTRYAYHHGYYDGLEREFRGFAVVDRWDTEEHRGDTDFPDAENWDAASWSPPMRTRSWFHTGAFELGEDASRTLRAGYWREPREPGCADTTPQLSHPVLDDGSAPGSGPLSPADLREAARSLKGSVLRSESYAEDGSPRASVPYTIEEHDYQVRCLQRIGGQRHGVFFSRKRESVTAFYDRIAHDPRVEHNVLLEADEFGQPLRAVAIAYGRRRNQPAPEPGLPPDVQARLAYDQSRSRLRATRTSWTNPVLTTDAHLLPLVAQVVTWEIAGARPAAAGPRGAGLFTPAELDSLWAAVDRTSATVPYERASTSDVDGTIEPDPPNVAPTRREVARHRTHYRRDDLTGLLELGRVEPMGLPGREFRLAFTPGLLARAYGSAKAAAAGVAVTDAELIEGGYVHCDGHEGWWIPGEEIRYSGTDGDSAAAELSQAREHFYRVRRVLDPFGVRRDDYDRYDLGAVRAVDHVGNEHSAKLDYRTLAPWEVTDPNGNRAEVLFDALGMVTASAVRGKENEDLGDNLDGVVADLDPAFAAHHLADPLADPLAVLGNASSRTVYDLDAFWRTRDDAQPRPVVAWTIDRETHLSDLRPGQQTRCRHALVYSDGSGHEAQHKMQAEPGPLVEGGPRLAERWVGSGWTVRDNKGRPIRAYQKFFSSTPRFEFAVQHGVSTVRLYDPPGRAAAILYPDGTWTKSVSTPWSRTAFDRGDTAAIPDPRADPDVGGYFARLLGNGPFTSWVALRGGGDYGGTAADRAANQDAAVKTTAYADTPAVEYLDAAGRTCLTVTDLGPGGRHGTRHAFDCLGETIAVLDPQGRRLLEYLERELQPDGTTAYVLGRDLADREMLHHHMDSGGRWMLVDIGGRPIRGWDERGFATRTRYDAARRPTHRYVTAPAGRERLQQRTFYGEGRPAANLCGEVFRHYDAGGFTANNSCDFKGNLVDRSRRLSRSYRGDVDWAPIAELDDIADADLAALLDAATTGLLEPEVFQGRALHDALNRPVLAVAPHVAGAPRDIVMAGYNEAGLVGRVDLWEQSTDTPDGPLDPDTAPAHPVRDIDYDAEGQRQRVVYGNGTVTTRAYDPQTLALLRLTTTRPGSHPAAARTVQDLSYTYDPLGNVTRLRDDADIHDVVFFRNQRVDPTADYTYDAGYRLIRATGREHLGQAGVAAQVTDSDRSRIRLPSPGDGRAMANYAETYDYDPVGNLLAMAHRVAGSGWTRRYQYAEASRIEPGLTGDRLSATSLPGDPTDGPYSARYGYDAHGNTTSMPHLAALTWDEQNQLTATTRTVVHEGTGETVYYVYDSGGVRIRKVVEAPSGSGGGGGTGNGGGRRLRERIYLGSAEYYREFDLDGETVTLERTQLAVAADRRLVALLERRTIGTDPAPARQLRYQYTNHLPTVCLELNETAAVLSYEEYFPYGSTSYQAVSAQTDLPKRYRWSGKERDEENGLSYHSARYYAPWLGRWTSADPEHLADGPNVYAYARQNPITVTDPTGTVGVAIGAGALIVEFGGAELLGGGALAVTEGVGGGSLLAGGAATEGLLGSAAVRWGGVALLGGLGLAVTGYRYAARPEAHPFAGPYPVPAPAPPVPIPVPPPPVPDTKPPAPVPVAPPIPIPVPPIPIPVPPVPIPVPHTTPRPRAVPRTRSTTDALPRTWDIPRARQRRKRALRYLTYTKVNPKTGRTYVGYTSGYGTVAELLKWRDAYHHMNLLGYGPARLDRVVDATLPYEAFRLDPSYWAIRGREQQMIDRFGGAIREKGLAHTRSGNDIRGVGKRNRAGRLYDAAATAAFGRVAPYTGK